MINSQRLKHITKGLTDSPAKTDKTPITPFSVQGFVSNVSFVSEGLRFEISSHEKHSTSEMELE